MENVVTDRFEKFYSISLFKKTPKKKKISFERSKNVQNMGTINTIL